MTPKIGISGIVVQDFQRGAGGIHDSNEQLGGPGCAHSDFLSRAAGSINGIADLTGINCLPSPNKREKANRRHPLPRAIAGSSSGSAHLKVDVPAQCQQA